jgi:hypothetical protein
MLQKRLANKYAICYTVSIVTEAYCLQAIFLEIIMTKVQKRELARLTAAIKQTMVSICYQNLDSDNIENDVDVAFTAIEHCFPEFDCITDTVTRRCAKTEIHDVLTAAQEMCKVNGNRRGVLEMIEQSITAESVMDDIIDMNDDE